ACQVPGCESALDDNPSTRDISRRRRPSRQGGITAMATFPHWLCHLQQLAGTLLTLLVDYRAHTLFLKGLGGVRGVKFTYDPRYNIAYIRFREKHGDIDSVRISDELVVD